MALGIKRQNDTFRSMFIEGSRSQDCAAKIRKHIFRCISQFTVSFASTENYIEKDNTIQRIIHEIYGGI